MALPKTIEKRLINGRYFNRLLPAVNSNKTPSATTHTLIPPNALETNFHREYITSAEIESKGKGFFRRFLHRRSINHSSAARFPEFLSLPVGEKLREKLRSLNVNIVENRPGIDKIPPPVMDPAIGDSFLLSGLTVDDTRKLLKLSLVEKVKLKLREIQSSSISVDEFVRICVDGCENEKQGIEISKILDEAGNVIVLGNVVLLRPDQVAKSVATVISEATATPNDPRKRELDQMEKQKSEIDQKAKSLVRGELYCGLGFLMAQTLGFMRLTFWELSWDVMEPICFFVTSLHFAMSYGFFLRTSTEPTFEGFFQRRFKAKQLKLMKAHNFDLEKYQKLTKMFYPESSFRASSLHIQQMMN